MNLCLQKLIEQGALRLELTSFLYEVQLLTISQTIKNQNEIITETENS